MNQYKIVVKDSVAPEPVTCFKPGFITERYMAYYGPIDSVNEYVLLEHAKLAPTLDCTKLVIDAPQSELLICLDDFPDLEHLVIKAGDVCIVDGCEGQVRKLLLESESAGSYTICHYVDALIHTEWCDDLKRLSALAKLKDRFSWWLNRQIFKRRYSCGRVKK